MYRVVTAMMILALMMVLQKHIVSADPVLPLPTMPICGDQGDPESAPLFQCPDFAPLAEVQMFRVPGTEPIDVTIDFVFRQANFNNELALFHVDDLNGLIDGLKPGEPGYLAAALNRAIIVFPSGSDASVADTTLHFNGGDILVFFIVQADALAKLLTQNPNNEPGKRPLAFFSIDSLNPDGIDHFVAFEDGAKQITQFGFEDQTQGGDVDYDDVVFNTTPRLQSVTGLLFPLKGTSSGVDEQLNPYKAPIISVFDHQMTNRNAEYGNYRCDDVVESYTGEVGSTDPDVQACRHHPGFAQENALPFYVNGHYVGSGDTRHLNYDGHPGIDYQAEDGTEVYAAVSGIVQYPKAIVGIRRPRARAYNSYHVLELVPDLFPGYKIYYLHLSTHPATGQTIEKEDTTPGCPTAVSLPLPQGTHVNAGCLIALSGISGWEGSPRLQFEIQRVVPIEQVKEEARAALQCLDNTERACVPVDPYGWDGDGSDPYELITGLGSIRLWAHRPVINSISPTSVSSGTFDLTIIGDGFEAGMTEKLVGQSDFGELPPGTVLSQSGTQLIIRESLAPGTYFVHVQNSDGRRSNWKKLEVQ